MEKNIRILIVDDHAIVREGLRGLIEESFSLSDRILQLDRALETPAGTEANPVGEQRQRIEHAFPGRPRLVVSN